MKKENAISKQLREILEELEICSIKEGHVLILLPGEEGNENEEHFVVSFGNCMDTSRYPVAAIYAVAKAIIGTTKIDSPPYNQRKYFSDYLTMAIIEAIPRLKDTEFRAQGFIVVDKDTIGFTSAVPDDFKLNKRELETYEMIFSAMIDSSFDDFIFDELLIGDIKVESAS